MSFLQQLAQLLKGTKFAADTAMLTFRIAIRLLVTKELKPHLQCLLFPFNGILDFCSFWAPWSNGTRYTAAPSGIYFCSIEDRISLKCDLRGTRNHAQRKSALTENAQWDITQKPNMTFVESGCPGSVYSPNFGYTPTIFHLETYTAQCHSLSLSGGRTVRAPHRVTYVCPSSVFESRHGLMPMMSPS